MSNAEIAKQFELLANLMRIHNDNEFKARSYANAAFQISRLSKSVSGMEKKEIHALRGVGDTITTKIDQLLNGEPIKTFEELMNKTPLEVIKMLEIKGLGAKKIAVLWKEHDISNIHLLLEACNKNQLISMKGFSDKTQTSIKENIEFFLKNKDKYLYVQVEGTANALVGQLRKNGFSFVSLTGAIRRKCEVIDVIELIVVVDNEAVLPKELTSIFSSSKVIDKDGISCAEGITNNGIRLIVYLSSKEQFSYNLFKTTGNQKHVEEVDPLIKIKEMNSEEEIYRSAKLDFIEPELREGHDEVKMAIEKQLPELVKLDDFKGVMHIHSVYSDGHSTIEELANQCKQHYAYMGITDHSKAAVYANGLTEKRILQQHKEIDQLNQKLTPFVIFKGIECDILFDGSLDYDNKVLSSFDFVIISIHSSFKMDKAKATERLIKAIENPYTTILGHMTGRLLLTREGYPIDHKKVIDTCAANNVAIELNANPIRLDMDWRWIPYALEKGINIPINPDAHTLAGLNDVKYGVNVARKAGMGKEDLLNNLSLKEIKDYFFSKKSKTITT